MVIVRICEHSEHACIFMCKRGIRVLRCTVEEWAMAGNDKSTAATIRGGEAKETFFVVVLFSMKAQGC